MFAEQTNNKTKIPAEGKTRRAETPPGGKIAPELNPIWQSLALRSAIIQPKLAVSQPNDPSEREADHIADRVMRMAMPPSSDNRHTFSPFTSQKAQRKCGTCEDEEEKKVQRKEQGSSADSTATAPPIVHEALSSSGQPLDAGTRSFMEGRFGLDFTGVRIHAGAQAGASTASLHALAYTVGPDIVFGPGQYAPGTPDGRRLLAHELAHVAHQQGAPPTAPQALSIDESGEQSADASSSVALGERPGRARDFLGARGGVQRIQRQTLKLRNQNEVGVPSAAGAAANVKSDAVDALKRLLDLWAIDVTTFDLTVKTTWKNYGPTDVIGAADLQALKDAITKNEIASLAAPVANNFLALNPPITDSVGVGGTNDAKDVTAVQRALIAHGLMAPNTASGTVDAATKTAIKNFKQSVASGTFGLDPLRENERVDGRDRFAGGTFRVQGGPMTIKVPAQPAKGKKPAQPAQTLNLNKAFTVYVSSKVPPDKNKVHLFFTPLPDEEKFVNEQGLRSEHESSDWILIAVPGLFEHLIPNFVTVSTAEIQTCLSAIQRSTTIDSIRLSAHSRGHRGLEQTMGFSGKPLINLNLVERVTVFDASYHDLGATLTAHTKDLTRMQDPSNKSALAAGTVNLYDATVTNISGFKGKSIDVSGIRALSYVRFVEQGLKLGKIDKIDIAALKNDPKKDVQGATNRLLAALQNIPRGAFSTRSPTPTGKTDLSKFISANRADLTLVDDAKDGLSKLVTSENLDLGYKFDLDPEDPNRTLTAHHWLAAELGHESVD
jgi:hypothetical protein